MQVLTSSLCLVLGSLAVILLAILLPVTDIANSYLPFTCKNNSSQISKTVLRQRKLVIGILSGREHFEKRQAIRNTWLQDLNQNDIVKDVSYRFVIGNKGCGVHSLNRKDLYSCDRQNFTLNAQMEKEHFDIISLKERSDVPDFSKYNLIWNTSLKVRYPVIVKRLGLLSIVKLSKKPVIIQLYDENTEDIVISASFSSVDPGIIYETSSDVVKFRFQPTSQVILPKDYECLLRILSVSDKNIDVHMLSKYSSIDNSGGTVELIPIDEKGFYYRTMSENIFMGNVVISIKDADQLKDVIKNQPHLDEQHLKSEMEITKQLETEDASYNDLLFVNITDTYRNLPLKLLYFHKWIHSNFNTQFVLKSDDDCFINIRKVLTELPFLPKGNKVWWGNFRDNWFVERFGKWAEKNYRSTEYPSFACGSGNIVSKEISDWLAGNAEVLYSYQGEDTSMGIWLSALGPSYVDDKSWLCDKGCDVDALVIPQLSTEEMKLLWKNRLTCNNICGCD